MYFAAESLRIFSSCFSIHFLQLKHAEGDLFCSYSRVTRKVIMLFLDLEFPIPRDYFGVIGVQRPLEDRSNRTYPEIHPSQCHDKSKRLPPLPQRPKRQKNAEGNSRIVYFGTMPKQRSESLDEEKIAKRKKKMKNIFIPPLKR